MSNAIFTPKKPVNEPVKDYVAGSFERIQLDEAIAKLKSEVIDIPMYINGNEITSSEKINIVSPHNHNHTLGLYNKGKKEHVTMAIDAALNARKQWANMSWEHRASIFLKAADLIAGPYRAKMNAATMIGQSKNAMQAEIDSACELIDFLRFNVQYMTEIYADQPISSPGIWNRVDYRPLEGFTFAITPFNFTAIAGNLPSCMALMGNVVVWKPAATQVYSANVIMQVFKEAGLPDGVINMVMGDSGMVSDVVLSSPHLAGVHFTGSTGVFNDIWKTIGNNIATYKTYPRIVGETGGKDFIIAHPSANAKQVATGISRGAFEFQGQKCSAASRVYIPQSLWPAVQAKLEADLKSMKMGSPEDMSNFITAVISEASFDKLARYIDQAKNDSDAEVIMGGNYDKSKGYFIEPTVILTTNPKYTTMETELFGPVVTIYVYEDAKWSETLKLVDETSEYALTGAVFSQCRYAVEEATVALQNAAGNFYINDKPTGAVVGMQPFGGARGSGTNDKAGSAQNLLRWASVRTIKETFVTPEDYKYPFLG